MIAGLIYIGLMVFLGLLLVSQAIGHVGNKIAERPMIIAHEHHIYALSKDGWVKFNPDTNSWSTVNSPVFKLVDKE